MARRIVRDVVFVEPSPTRLDEEPLLFGALSRRAYPDRRPGDFLRTYGLVILVCFAALSAWAFIALAATEL